MYSTWCAARVRNNGWEPLSEPEQFVITFVDRSMLCQTCYCLVWERLNGEKR